ncbi:hypothetical protein K4K59_012426 [Colletotrichum sp. SAR11_240]|nr:hypothetical protein K4K59_012426 [Colletotrichum sp. SAR11_240]
MDTPEQPASASGKTRVPSVADISVKTDTPGKPVSDSDKTKVPSVTETASDTSPINALNQSKVESQMEEIERLKQKRDDLKAANAVLEALVNAKKRNIVETPVDWRSLAREMNKRMDEAERRWTFLSESQ